MDVERAKFFESYFPPAILEKLKPYAHNVGEVLRWNTDFPHQKYHIFDNLLHFRHYDFECLKTQRIMDNMDEEDKRRFRDYPNLRKWWDIDLLTYDLIERAIRLHDTGRLFVERGVLKPEEHHFGGLFVAMHVDSDPRVWEAVFRHVDDVLSENASTVSRYVRDLDRVVGAGYIGLIRIAKYYGFNHSLFEETDEDKVVSNGIMMAIPDRFGVINESSAKDFFWENVYPYFVSGGPERIRLLGTLCKIMLDRIVGRDYTKLDRKLTSAEKDVLSLDNNSRVVEEVMPRLRNTFSYKIRNTLEVLVETREGILSSDEEEDYL